MSKVFSSVRMVGGRLMTDRPRTYGRAWLSALASCPLLLAVLLIGGWALGFGGWPWERFDLLTVAWWGIALGVVQSYKVMRTRRRARPAEIDWLAGHPDRP